MDEEYTIKVQRIGRVMVYQKYTLEDAIAAFNFEVRDSPSTQCEIILKGEIIKIHKGYKTW